MNLFNIIELRNIKIKIFYTVLCITIILFVSVIFFEILLQTLPFIYRLIPTNNNIQYVYVLGESTADGYPYHKISYSKIIKNVIKDKRIDNKKIKLIHLEQSGCQLYHQYLYYVLYRYLHPTHRGIMLLYIGTNNWAIEELYSTIKRNLLLKLGIYQLLDKYLRFVRFKDFEVGGYDFQYEYEKIVLLAKKFGEDVYMSTISGNYEFPPNTNNTPIENEEIDKLYFSKDYIKAKELCIRYLEDEKYKDKSQFWYRLGMILKKENKITEANEALFKSVMCYYNIDGNPTVFQNEVIRKIAKKYNVPLFDFFEQLCNSGKIIGFDFFIDAIHPNIETHVDIAYGFINLLSRKYNFTFTKKEDLDIEKLKKALKFKKEDMAEIYSNELIELKRNKYAIKFNKETYLKWKKDLGKTDITNDRKYINRFLEIENEWSKNRIFDPLIN